MGRALSCCASVDAAEAASAFKQGEKAKTDASKPGKPPPILTSGKEPLLARDKTGGSGSNRSGRGKSPGPSTPLRKLGSRPSMDVRRSGRNPPLPPSTAAVHPAASEGAVAADAPKLAAPGASDAPSAADAIPVAVAQAPSVSEPEPAPANGTLQLPEPDPPSPTTPVTPLTDSTPRGSQKRRKRNSRSDKMSGPVAPPCLGGNWSEIKLVRAPVAGEVIGGEPSISGDDFVMLRPLPYEPVPWDRSDNNRQRSFVYKGGLVQVPLLPFQDLENGVKPVKAKPEEVRQGKGWKMVKSKVVGGAIKAEK
eukprot:TRINITY_DN84653_c0_g1_i1.p1 TRINITY_DN84653_c0_g1~~TRINITY_DN84653_c0_g1_i1.p1  ORF type:complete len:308 (-),score=56.38 TRINITY_DN84653_c0_g1_i1:52-975(-)